jgi:hypothetical protein
MQLHPTLRRTHRGGVSAADSERYRDSGSVFGGSQASISVLGVEEASSRTGGPVERATAPSTPSTTHQLNKRLRLEDEAGLAAERGAAFMSGPSSLAPAGNPFTEDDAASPELRHFAPLLVTTNEARRKLCSAVERPPRSAEFAYARLRPFWSSATSSGPFQGEAQEIFRAFGEVRSVTVEMMRTTARAMRLHWLANQTQGANRDTGAAGAPRGDGCSIGQGRGRLHPHYYMGRARHKGRDTPRPPRPRAATAQERFAASRPVRVGAWRTRSRFSWGPRQGQGEWPLSPPPQAGGWQRQRRSAAPGRGAPGAASSSSPRCVRG